MTITRIIAATLDPALVVTVVDLGAMIAANIELDTSLRSELDTSLRS